MGKKIALLLLIIVVPVVVARLVQSSTSASRARNIAPEGDSLILQSSGQTSGASLRAVVDELLASSADAWNAGDLEGFLVWYDKSPSTTFIGSSGRVHGWDEIRARYAPYFEPGAERPSLRFEDLEVRPLGPGAGLATARYVLFDAESATSTGLFTLIIEETAAGWRIVHDHSSADSI